MSKDGSRRENIRAGGLTLRVPKNSEAALFRGMPTSSNYFKATKEASPICPTDVSIKDGLAEYFYANLDVGLYHAGAHIPEYTAVCQIIYYTEQKAKDGLLIELSPTPHAKGGHEGESVMLNTEEFISEFLQSEKDSFGKEYERLFNTPHFLRPKDYKEKQFL